MSLCHNNYADYIAHAGVSKETTFKKLRIVKKQETFKRNLKKQEIFTKYIANIEKFPRSMKQEVMRNFTDIMNFIIHVSI